jgi:hypothetical protein
MGFALDIFDALLEVTDPLQKPFDERITLATAGAIESRIGIR